MAENNELPYICPEHPHAKVRHTWDQTHYVMSGYPAGTGTKSNHRYECAECGRELQPPANDSDDLEDIEMQEWGE
jgi:hypothetical protein